MTFVRTSVSTGDLKGAAREGTSERLPEAPISKEFRLTHSSVFDGPAAGPHRVGDVLADPGLYNEDLAPVPMEKRTWTGYSIFAMWMSDVHSVGGYTFAASLFLFGLTGWQVLLAMTVGSLCVYVLMNLIGRPSLREGIPYPVMARVSMGVMGANLAALIRGVVGVVWYGVQTYFASKAVAIIILLFIPSAAVLGTGSGFMGLSALGWISFLVM